MKERNDVVVADPRWPKHFVDLPVGEALAQDVQGKPLELGFVGRAALFELHQDRRLPVTFDTREINDHRVWLVEVCDGLDRAAKREKRCVVPCQERQTLLHEDAEQAIVSSASLLQLAVKERLELATWIVKHDDATLLQHAVKLSTEIVVERMHQAWPPLR